MDDVDGALKKASVPMQVVCGVAMVLNLLVVLVFARTKQLRVKYYGFIFNLVLADIAFPTIMIILIHLRHVPTVVALARAFLLTAQLSILAVAVNRLLALSLMPPARYDAVVTPARMVLACLLIWIVSAALFVPTTFLQDQKLNWLIQALLPLITLLITGVLYFAVFRKISKYQAPLASTTGTSKVDEQTSSRIRQTRHLMVTFTIIFVASAVCWLPFCVGFLILFAHGKTTFSVVIYLRYSYTVMTLNSALNPFVYWWRLKEGREALYHLFCGCRSNQRTERERGAVTIAETEM
ncbi:histamine H2 receptor-like [Acanthaster planci]|uniref:Histamine H2 receptor-like n=1 Tax=Acanthaster planci TaxID=133434 RepID=A0A8B7YYN3_ACAPL|nr:histamine H2 receptor-like [Acanthaster planci]XP_022098450.1 histamine H2 receptor-like [Acanthaster planci]